MTDRITIALDGATYQGSVALLSNNRVVAERTLPESDGAGTGSKRGERLMPAISECLAELDARGKDIERIVCGAGPGSFTSLRVAGSVAKGLASGYGVDLYALSSLLLTVAGVQSQLATGPYVSLLNAMRGEYYALRVMVEPTGQLRSMGRTGILSANELEEVQQKEHGLHFIGPGQAIDAQPHARGVGKVLEQVLKKGPVDLAAWEPDYGRLAEAQVRWEATHSRPLAR
ncbi:MAG: tRNA (adenosine(37)-N6)-threonylcarbamoyltransferase complex dimerization subunit type 1 TsaB [Gemmatimonadaceae bacterium]